MSTIYNPDPVEPPAEPQVNPQNTTPVGPIISGDLSGDSENPKSNKKALVVTLSIVAVLILLIAAPFIIFALTRNASAGKRLTDKATECGHEPVISVRYPSGRLGSDEWTTKVLVPDNPDYKTTVDMLKRGDEFMLWFSAQLLGGRSHLANTYCSEAEAQKDPEGAGNPDINNNASQSVAKAVSYFNSRFYYPTALDSTKQISGLRVSKDGTKYSFAITDKGPPSEYINSNSLFTCQKASITPGLVNGEYRMKPDPGYGIIFRNADVPTKLPSYRAMQYYGTNKDSVTPESAQSILDAFPYIQASEDVVCYFQQYGAKFQITPDIIDSVSEIPNFSAKNYKIELF